MNPPPITKCQRCRQDLTPGSGYCVGCGHSNEDLDAKQYGAIQDADAYIARVKFIWRFIAVYFRGFRR